MTNLGQLLQMTPLTRMSVTAASRIMLPSYVLLCVTVGLFYALDPGGKLQVAPVYRVQRNLMDMWLWGAIMLGLAALMTGALLLHNRFVMAYSLCMCALTWMIWAVAFGVGAYRHDDITALAPVLPLFVVVACIASTKSLLKSEA